MGARRGSCATFVGPLRGRHHLSVQYFEDSPDTRVLLKEDRNRAMKELDGYQHRAPRGRVTSTPLLDDGWMDFATYGTRTRQLGAIEHQLYGVPFVPPGYRPREQRREKTAPGALTAAFRKRVGRHDQPVSDLRTPAAALRQRPGRSR
jgi:hypothetical protein